MRTWKVIATANLTAWIVVACGFGYALESLLLLAFGVLMLGVNTALTGCTNAEGRLHNPWVFDKTRGQAPPPHT